MRNYIKYFWGSTLFAIIALSTAFYLGMNKSGSVEGGIATLFTALMLGILETSLSFDNAIVNARVLKGMSAFWRKIFLTLGVLIAVFGMRIVFPLILVWIISNLPLMEVLQMTVQEPQKFQNILTSQHLIIAGFGGAFLWMVFASFFFDSEKEVHWIPGLEKIFSKLGRKDSFAILITFCFTLGFYFAMPPLHHLDFLLATVLGVVTFLIVDGVGSLLDNESLSSQTGIGAFLYLEVLDASFSFDGVVGAFAITDNFFIIALGLGIGAFFVRSMTIKLVDDDTLSNFKFLENGAFWAIGALAFILYLSALEVEVPEVISGSLGLIIIGLSFLGSLRDKKKSK